MGGNLNQMNNDKISIQKNKYGCYIYSSSTWFDGCEYFTASFEDDYLIMNKHYLEVPKDAHKRNKTGQIFFNLNLPLGHYNFDDDTTEDELVVYINNT